MKKAVIVTGKLVQDHEFIYPYYRLQEDGYHVDVAVPGKEQTNGIIGVKVIPTMDVTDIRVEDFDVLVLPGGAKSMEYLRQNKDVLATVQAFDKVKKPILSICHAAQLLISAQIVKGRRVSGYYSVKDDINNAGATYVDEPAVVDDNLVTTAHYKDLGPWMKKGLEVAAASMASGGRV